MLVSLDSSLTEEQKNDVIKSINGMGVTTDDSLMMLGVVKANFEESLNSFQEIKKLKGVTAIEADMEAHI